MRLLQVALIFMTTLPMPAIKHWQEEDLHKSTGAYPLVGLIVGILLLGVYWLTQAFPLLLQAVLLLSIWLLLTGGLHFDGFCDTADAVFASKTAIERQAIAKDVNVGAFAFAAGACLLSIKIASIANLTNLYYLLNCTLLSRTLVLIAMSQFRLSNSSQLGRSASINFQEAILPLGLGLGLSIFGLIMFADTRSLILIPCTIVFLFLLSAWISKRMDGLNGDSYGAIIESSEAFMLVLASLL